MTPALTHQSHPEGSMVTTADRRVAWPWTSRLPSSALDVEEDLRQMQTEKQRVGTGSASQDAGKCPRGGHNETRRGSSRVTSARTQHPDRGSTCFWIMLESYC